MSLTDEFIARLADMEAGGLSRLRELAGQPLDETLQGFDLFTGLWWPLRSASPRAPERRSAWLVAKLYGAFPLPNVRASLQDSLPAVLGRAERREKNERNRERFRCRFDALLLSPFADLESHLRWALSVTSKALRGKSERGIDWAQLADDLSLWKRQINPKDTIQKHRLSRHAAVCRCDSHHAAMQDLWACEYLFRRNQSVS